MFPILAIPDEIETIVEPFRSLFGRREQWTNFKKYVTGLIVSIKGNVTFMSKQFIGDLNGDQSAMNKFLNSSQWNADELTETMIDTWIEDKKIGPTKKGIISIDDFLTEKTGKHMEGVGKFYDVAKKRYLLGHSIVSSTYYRGQYTIPLYWEPYVKKDDIERLSEKRNFKKKTEIALDIVDKIAAKGIKGVFAFDNAFMNKKMCQRIESHKRIWVSRVKSNRKILYKGRWVKLREVAQEIAKKIKHQQQLSKQAKRKNICREIKSHGKKYLVWSKYTKLAGIGKRKIFIIWLDCNLSNTPYFLSTNATWWEEKKAINYYNGRWAEEMLHRDEKQELGVEDYQVRSLKAFQRHVTAARFAHWLLMTLASFCPVSFSEEKGSSKRLTIGSLVRLLQAKTLQKFMKTLLELAENGETSALKNYLEELSNFASRFQIASKARIIVN